MTCLLSARRNLIRLARFSAERWLAAAVMGACLLGAADPLAAQDRAPVHYFHSSNLPPGVVGQGQLLRGGGRACYVQPVRIVAPEGALLSVAENGQFGPAEAKPRTVGMLIGQVYRLKVANIHLLEGEEVYPTIEVINRLYPPPGQELRFPIPIELTREELTMAINGHFVTRVIYLENPTHALPEREDPDQQRYFDVGSRDDPLQVADRLGRPMAILRMGSRVPEVHQPSGKFMFGTPPLISYPDVAGQPIPEVQPLDPQAIQRQSRIPRIPLSPFGPGTSPGTSSGGTLLR